MASTFTSKPKRGRRVGKRRKGASSARASARRGRRIGRRHAANSFGGGKGKFSFLGLDLMTGLLGGAGAVGSGLLTNFVAGYVPVDQLKSGPGKLLLRGGVTAALGLAAKKFLPSRIANPLLGGSLVGLGIDVIQTLVMPHLPIPAMSGYESIEQQLAAIEEIAPGSLNGLLAIEGNFGVSDGVFTLPTAA